MNDNKNDDAKWKQVLSFCWHSDLNDSEFYMKRPGVYKIMTTVSIVKLEEKENKSE